jgi:hypothetical protein
MESRGGNSSLTSVENNRRLEHCEIDDDDDDRPLHSLKNNADVMDLDDNSDFAAKSETDIIDID